MPRHLKLASGAPTAVTIPVGSSMADARRQLVLRAFANVDGDAERAAKQLGMEPGEVRRELLALLEGGTGGVGGAGGSDNGRRPSGSGVAAGELPASRAKPAKKK
jgi:hypothetical protein